ncbi:hypothetical protein C2845_PM05G32890 [Panicum miliaceum]|uniref:Aminotransferase-like plant mobile domain-containing protein n=1 Tax=Panicum miliaceum TaxID=4540 RepID=A0A3L6T1P6_PANMI|nr:hypothetical protein C2845_PM05G32890 [Panicum miliaceum]
MGEKMRVVKRMSKAVACSMLPKMEMKVLALAKNRSLIGPKLKWCHGGGVAQGIGMAHLTFPLLETFYDSKHRAHVIVDRGMAARERGIEADSGLLLEKCWGGLRRYMRYMDDLDCITQNQLHLPHHVKRQFWRLQDFQPEPISTSQALHNIDRKKRYSEKDWRVKHVAWLLQWEQRQRMEPTSGAIHRNNHYKEYLRWFHSVTGVTIRPPRSNVPVEERAHIDDEDDIVDEYDDITRAGVQPERVPLENYMLARLANEAGVSIAHASGGQNGDGHLRAFAERVRRSCKRMAGKLNCIAAPDDQFVEVAARAGASSACRTSSITRMPYHYGQGTTTTPSRSTSRTGSRAASKGKAASTRQDSSDSKQDNDSEDTDPTYEVVRMSQMMDAPLPTHTQGEPSQAAEDAVTASPPPRRQRRSRGTDITRRKVLPTASGRQRRPKLPFSPPEQPRRRR